MKKILIAITTTCALLFLLAAIPASAEGRIATVDLKKLFDGYWKTKQADAALKDRAADLDKEHKGMLADFNKAKENYKVLLVAASDQAIAESEREKRKQDAEAKLRDLKAQEDAIMKFETSARTTLDEQRRRMRDNILGEVRKAVESKSKFGTYSLVIDVAAETANGTPVIMFSNGENDITDAVLTQINSSTPPEALAPAPEKSTPKK